MKGSIRIIVGLIIVLATTSGLDDAIGYELLVLSIAAGIGIAAMYSGVLAITKQDNFKRK
jgi:hypothetical protein